MIKYQVDSGHYQNRIINPGLNVCGSHVGTLFPNESGSGTGNGTGPPDVNALSVVSQAYRRPWIDRTDSRVLRLVQIIPWWMNPKNHTRKSCNYIIRS